MFDLSHCGERIGSSNLESGDPETRSVSGIFKNLGGAKALAAFMKSIGGKEEEGAVYIAINEDFELLNAEQQVLGFAGGTLIAIPAEDETFVEFSELDARDYALNFSGHIEAMNGESG